MKKLKFTLLTMAVLLVAFGSWYYWDQTKAHPAVAVDDPNYVPKAPSLADIPEGEEGDKIREGHKLFMETSTALDGYVGNKLSCASCHANAGLGPSLDLIGVTKEYPQYKSRGADMTDIRERVAGCFTRSMNGNALPLDSPEMDSMVAYLDYISQYVPDGIEGRPWAEVKMKGDLPEADAKAGEEMFRLSCASCHAIDGSGNDEGSRYGLAVWGKDSYNNGAGMARLRTAAGFIQKYMPKAHMGTQGPGKLTDQEAVNLAAYINSNIRPDKPHKIFDWPKGDAPDDAAYPTLAKMTPEEQEKALKEWHEQNKELSAEAKQKVIETWLSKQEMSEKDKQATLEAWMGLGGETVKADSGKDQESSKE